MFIPDIYLNVLGGFQPEVVKEALGSRAGRADNGMPARFSLLVYPHSTVAFEYIDARADGDAAGEIHKLFERLARLDPEAFVGPKPEAEPHYRPLRFSAEAQIIFRDWYTAHNTALRNWDERGDPFLGHLHKYNGVFARLALVHHLSRYAAGGPDRPAPTEVDHLTAIAVRDFIETYLKPHARKIYTQLSRTSALQGAGRIAQWLYAERFTVPTFRPRDIRRRQWAGLTDQSSVNAALDYLENIACWIQSREVPTTQKGGRPTVVYDVNPLLKEI